MKDGEFICPLCGGRLIWGSAGMAYEGSDCFDEEDDAQVNWFLCERCGRDYEVVDPPREEREEKYSDYWNI